MSTSDSPPQHASSDTRTTTTRENYDAITECRNIEISKFYPNTIEILPKYYRNITLKSTRRTDHDLDHLDPNLPLRNVMQDPSSAYPTQETCPTITQIIRLPPANMR